MYLGITCIRTSANMKMDSHKEPLYVPFRTYLEVLRGPELGIIAARSSEQRSDRHSDRFHGQITEVETDDLSESDTEVHTELDPENQMAFKRLTPRNDSSLFSSREELRVGLGVEDRAGHRLAFRVVLGVIAGADLGMGIGGALDAVLR